MPDKETSDMLRRFGAFLGATGVAAGAFGAHALKETLSRKAGALDNWRTAVAYQLFHAAALLAVSSLAGTTGWGEKDKPSSRELGYYSTGGKMMAIGTMMFSGSIYCLTLDYGPKKLFGPVTPLGGLLMIGGWVMIGLGS